MSVSRGDRRKGFVAVVAMLLLAATAASVIASSGTAAEGARLSRASLEAVRARAGARAGGALALSAARAGLGADEIVTDLGPVVMTFEEPSDNPEGVWVARAACGQAFAEATVEP